MSWAEHSREASQCYSLKQSTSTACEASQTTPPFEGTRDNSNSQVCNINIPTSAYQDLTKIPSKMVSSSKDDAAFLRLISCPIVCVYAGWSGIRINAALHRRRLGNITTLVWSANKTMDPYPRVGPCIIFLPVGYKPLLKTSPTTSTDLKREQGEWQRSSTLLCDALHTPSWGSIPMKLHPFLPRKPA